MELRKQNPLIICSEVSAPTPVYVNQKGKLWGRNQTMLPDLQPSKNGLKYIHLYIFSYLFLCLWQPELESQGNEL